MKSTPGLSTAVLVTAVLGLSLTGCGKEPVADAASGQPDGYAAPNGVTEVAGPPGASGEVAEVSGRTLQVQNAMTGQVAVTWTGKTTFTQEVSATLADVSVGDCVMVTPTDSSSGSTTVAADRVRITTPVDGECTPAGDRGPGGMPDGMMTSGPAPEGMPADLPTDLPTDLPSDAPGGFRSMAGAFGKVTAVSASGFTVESVQMSAPGSTESATSAVTVTVTGDTSYSMTAKATGQALKVGVCVDARGDEDSTGAVTATSIAISPKVDGQCGSFGFGGPVVRKAG